MECCRLRSRWLLALVAVAILAFIPSIASAQGGFGGGGFGGGGGGFGGGGGGFGGGGFGGGGGGNQQNAGVIIDPQGVLRLKTFVDPGGLRAKRIVEAAMRSLDPKLSKPTALRKISLNRLEEAVAKQLATGEGLTDEMKYLAGMLRIHYVFFYPETNDIVVAGPAEGFAEDLTGRVRGVSSGRPVLELQDLIVALRAFSPSGNKLNTIGVSIDPTPAGLQRMRQTYASMMGRVGPGQAAQIAQTLRNALGRQVVSVQGISPETHFAQVLVEADYRMKLIGIGLERPPVKFKNYVERASVRSMQRNAMERWYFTPDYKCLRVSSDNLALQMVGWGVRLVSEAELVQEGGIRVQGAALNKASQAYCQAFTDKSRQQLVNKKFFLF